MIWRHPSYTRYYTLFPYTTLFLSYALYPHMTVAGNLAFGLKLRGHDKASIASRVAEAAKTLELDQLLDRKPGALSGGQRQRVALGRALVRKPQVFLDRKSTRLNSSH